MPLVQVDGSLPAERTLILGGPQRDRLQSRFELSCLTRQRNTTEQAADWCLALVLFVLSFLYLCIFRRYTLLDPDEGIVLEGAQRILHGQVLYRDFFSFFTPGSYYFNALLFRWFGDSLLVARTAVAFIGAALAGIMYLLARRVCGRAISFAVTGLVTLSALPFRFMVLHNWDSTLLACLALYCSVRWLESARPAWACAAGSFVSLTGLFEQSKGAGLMLGLLLGFLLIGFFGNRRELFRRACRVAAVVGLAWPLTITVAYFASQHALRPMLAGWLWPLQHYSTANRVPYGYQNLSDAAVSTIFFSGSWGIRMVKILAISPSLWIPILPLFAIALLPRLSLKLKRDPYHESEWSHYVLAACAILGLLLSVVVVRPDIVHFVYLQPIFFLLLAWMLGGRNICGPLVRRLGPVIAFLAVLSLLGMATVLLLRAAGSHSILRTRRGVVSTPVKDNVIEPIQAHTAAGEHILAYPYSSMLYYLTGTYSPTAFDYYQPGMHTRDQALDFLSQLRAHPVRVIVYEPGFGNHIRESWPNTRAEDLASDPIADYIAQHYQTCAALDSAANFHYLLMIRRDLACQ